MSVSVVVCVPRLHPESVPVWARDAAFCLPCGLEESTALLPRRSACAARELIRRALPLGAARSREVIEELLRLGETHGCDGMLSRLSALRFQDDAAREEAAEERAALENFLSPVGGAVPGAQMSARGESGKNSVQDDPARRRMLVDSQKLLLLAYVYEKNMRELANLEDRVFRAEASLRASLGEENSRDAAAPVRRASPASVDASLKFPLSWRMVLEAMLPFVPDKALFLTADREMFQDLHAAGLLRPCPADRAKLLPDVPDDVSRGLLYARAPAWSLLLRPFCPEDRPWLERECEVLATDGADETSP
jgi:hypothetical protein